MKKFQTYTEKSQDVANKGKENRQQLILWPNLILCSYMAVKMRRYGSLIKINPSGRTDRCHYWPAVHLALRISKTVTDHRVYSMQYIQVFTVCSTYKYLQKEKRTVR